MKLWDMLSVATYWQEFTIYVTNAYDENLLVGRGTRSELMGQEHFGGAYLTFDHLQDVVDFYRVKDSRIIIFLRDSNFNNHVADQYPADYAKTWDRNDKTTRPYLFGSETEGF